MTASEIIYNRADSQKEKLEVFLKINEYNILKDNGKIKREIADKLALDEYKKYRAIQKMEKNLK